MHFRLSALRTLCGLASALSAAYGAAVLPQAAVFYVVFYLLDATQAIALACQTFGRWRRSKGAVAPKTAVSTAHAERAASTVWGRLVGVLPILPVELVIAATVGADPLVSHVAAGLRLTRLLYLGRVATALSARTHSVTSGSTSVSRFSGGNRCICLVGWSCCFKKKEKGEK